MVVLGHRLWQNRYGGERNVLGQTIRVNGEPATIVGVMPGMMQFPNNAELWVAVQPDAGTGETRHARAARVRAAAR